ncbi:hypothetical protein DPEC_G00064460 [Dallia pectoralis]|uniref:Uncharacterized protein n=1 Tax=Dallia pectoralis TaxID=75939 RepID=A0ACC2H8F6_DALPE|nr:hypothetical protein DPEC_G00064460 [Dallia pectoralis]
MALLHQSSRIHTTVEIMVETTDPVEAHPEIQHLGGLHTFQATSWGAPQRTVKETDVIEDQLKRNIRGTNTPMSPRQPLASSSSRSSAQLLSSD